MTDAMHGELLAVIAMAASTNALVNGLGLEPDPEFLVKETG